MDTQKTGIVEKIVEALSVKSEPKGEDYYKIWDSWGMTMEEWKSLPTHEAK